MALKRRGVSLRVIDKAGARTDKSKALVLWPRTLELLDIQGCTQPFLDAGVQGNGARIMARQNMLVHLQFKNARGNYPYALMIPQSETERVLEEQLALLGVQVERNVELASFTHDDQGATAVLRHGDGRDETLPCSWLIGCDGAHSTVRHTIGARFEGDTLPSDWMLADVVIDGPIPHDELTICWTPAGILAFFPIGTARFRVIADLGHAMGTDAPAPTLEEVQQLLDQRGPPGLKAHDAVWTSRFRINERKVGSYRQGRVFLCGDAAHVHSPAGGQGMNTGMQDAFNLAWKLALVVHGHAAPALLDSYSPERSAVGDQVLRNAGLMTKVAILRNPVLRAGRNAILGVLGKNPKLRQRMVNQLTEMDVHYPNSPLTLKAPGAARHPACGERAPDLALNARDDAASGHAASSLHELLAGGKFVVLSVAAKAVDLPDELRAVATSARVDAAPGYQAGYAYLIRPDAYVATSAQSDDAQAVVAALKRIAAMA